MKNVGTERCLDCLDSLMYDKRDDNTPLGVLEAVLLCKLKECVEDSYSEPAKLHVRYMELLDK